MTIRHIPAGETDELRTLLAEVRALRADVERDAHELIARWGAPTTGAAASRASNLASYVALRARDVIDLQYRLAAFGLTSLGRSEAGVAASFDALNATLTRLCGEGEPPYPDRTGIRAGRDDLRNEARRLFGPRNPEGPRARIMATLPPEAADDAALVKALVVAGVDCARINCAHDDARAWERMIANVRAAEKETGRACRVLMDIAGPKCRIDCVEAPEKHRLFPGGRAALVTDLDLARRDDVAFTISFPEIVGQLEVGATVHVDDGKAVAEVVETSPGRAVLEVRAAREKGVRLKADKGLNFPATEILLPPLTKKDFADLDFVASHADLVGYSFVQRVEDVDLIDAELAKRRPGQPPLPVVLKIETALAVRNLPRLLVRAMARGPAGVMIARGDLAVELGFARLSEMQEEILWLCEAAHMPVVWATQVLDLYVRDGVATRAELTDAAMAQAAECVMLNKGPHLVEGVAFLRDVLMRMDRHRAKKFPRYARLNAWA